MTSDKNYALIMELRIGTITLLEIIKNFVLTSKYFDALLIFKGFNYNLLDISYAAHAIRKKYSSCILAVALNYYF